MLNTLKELVDKISQYKFNSLQLYVVHAYKFEVLKDITKAFGCLTKEEVVELDAYCKVKDNYINPKSQSSLDKTYLSLISLVALSVVKKSLSISISCIVFGAPIASKICSISF